MKQKIFFSLILILTIIITYLICHFQFKKRELELKNSLKDEIKKEILISFEKNKSEEEIYVNNNCELGYVIYSYEQLFNSNYNRGIELHAKYDKKNSERELDKFVKEVQENFSKDDKDFWELFLYNKKALENLSKKNMQILHPKKYYDRNKVQVSAFAMSIKIGAEHNFIDGELKYLKELLNTYCHIRQDNETCINTVLNK